MSVWEALVELDRNRPRVGDQLVGALRDAISRGRLAPGTRLPSTRDLAADLGVSRGLVVGAYEQLTAEGRLVTRRGSGTVVAAVATAVPARREVLPERTTAVAPLRPGVPDLGMFPRTAWRRAYETALTGALDADFDYGDAVGVPRLRQELSGYLGRVRAALVPPEGLIVTAGVTQGLALVARALVARGVRRIAFEDPGSAALRDHVGRLGLEVVPIPVDEDGLDVRALSRTRTKAVLLTPAHQFPTGVVLAPHRRAELVGWARRVDGLIVEDDYDAEYRYDREPVACLQGLAPDRVALVGSVSKVLAPGLRLGWLVAPPAWLPELCAAKADADNGGPALQQLAFAEFLSGGGYDKHLRRARRLHRERRDAIVAALRRHLPKARVGGIAAGLHLVVELPPGADDVAVVERAAAAGLGPLALSALRMRKRGPAGLVLGYAAHTPHELTRAVRTLATLV
ncbi:PLP-dependent aminotransferase family protein [Dactylosporangium sp. AC04546]|uniref:MocR-like pyridoxine biosynthesis transcription factor PdxR n=1 Tax=Dactylosporangium sp. AC04546 TaxID=2862460 RepID=UPI001EE09730|nr:PLP-dependent aminotransferase family protein [Dactylosporangium sp. AC04546]WVK83086.1 PLP-dependent aminotransferase family protein [Dactylosporangium sp. AC04546]